MDGVQSHEPEGYQESESRQRKDKGWASGTLALKSPEKKEPPEKQQDLGGLLSLKPCKESFKEQGGSNSMK